MPNKWTDKYAFFRLKVGKFITVLSAWGSVSDRNDQDFHLSVSFEPVKFIPTEKSLDDSKLRVLQLTKKLIEQMLLDINQAIEEEGKEE